MFGKMLDRVRERKPLVHSITNYVTANDCANMLLACGASPIMADDAEEVAEITSTCDGLAVNIGTPSARGIEAMLIAGGRANELGHPVVLDPVGVGASKLRTEAALRIVREVRPAVIRGNMSEIRTLVAGGGTTRGVEADAADTVTEETLDGAVAFAKKASCELNAIIAVTGSIDIVTDGERAYCIRNGHPMMSAVTGTGCQLSVLTAAYVTANPEHPLEAAAAAVCAMGLAGEVAYRRLRAEEGNATYRSHIIDAIFRMTAEQLASGANYEIR